MSETPGYSIVIASMEGNEDMLLQCLGSIKNYTEGTYEVVLVVNGGDFTDRDAIASSFDFVRTIHVEDAEHFAAAYNRGLAEARGDYLIAMNDDVLVPSKWNVRMMRALNNFESKYGERRGCPAPAMVGPVSNYVGGAQKVPDGIAQKINPMNYADAAEQIAESNPEEWVPVPFLSGFCVMIGRGFYAEHAPEFFDERLKNGAEDNLISLKALMEGKSLVISGEVFVYHYGSQTIEKTDPDGGRGVRNLFDYYQIAQDEVMPDYSKIASCCRVRLLAQEHLDYFCQALEQQTELADAIFIVNDRSDEDLWRQAEEHIEAVQSHVPVRVHSYLRGHDEYRDRSKLLQMARDYIEDETEDPETAWWYLSFDADEIFEDKVTRDYLDRLTNPPRPDILQYMVHWYTFWDEANKLWRADSTFGRMYGVRLARMLPGYEMMKTDSGLHMGNCPGVGMVGASRMSSVRIKHYGYSTEEERRRKHEFYSKVDQVRNVREVGGEDYDHLVSSLVQLVPWQEENTLTIGTCVLNEEVPLHNYLDQVWPFADQLIFCDTGSEDRTVELLEFFGAKVLDFQEETGIEWDPSFKTSGGDLSMARNTLWPYIETDWFWHYDIDEVLIPGQEGKLQGHPFGVIRRLIESRDTNCYQFIFRNIHPSGAFTMSQTTRLVRLYEGKDWYYTGYIHETLDDAARDEQLDLCPIQVQHNGWLCDDMVAKGKLKRYLRGNLRMIQDYPDDPKGWFNAALHLFDVGFEQAATKFIVQAVTRKPHFAAARKELITQGAKQLFESCRELADIVPDGHPFDQFAREVAQQVKPYMADHEKFRRAPEHVMEVLGEEGFDQIKAQILQLEGIQENASPEDQR